MYPDPRGGAPREVRGRHAVHAATKAAGAATSILGAVAHVLGAVLRAAVHVVPVVVVPPGAVPHAVPVLRDRTKRARG
eukprot:5119563-Pyramimonas_sp.AAC.1